MMLLCLDAGNTRLKWGLHDGRDWRGQGAIAHADCLPDCLPLIDRLPEKPSHLLACNVAGTAVAGRIATLATALAVPVEWFSSGAQCCGVRNGYDNPTQLGVDRWAALIGARTLQEGNLLVVMAGTATTIDVLDAAGSFRGGVILPGLDLMRTALARNTAGLPAAHGTYREIPTNTDAAIVGGTLHATLGAIERLARSAFGTAAADAPSVVLSGGAAAAIAPHLAQPLRCSEYLVLEGLARFARI